MDELREKAIKGLECCTTPNEGLDMCKINECPYRKSDSPKGTCEFYLMDDALTILKAQEARVMSLDEIMEIYNTRKTHIWPHDTAPYMFVEEHPDIHTYHGSWTAWREIMAILSEGMFIHTRNTYGKTWRCWTSRPTDEQSEAVKWE